MAATGILQAARTAVADAITAKGLTVVTDPRNARPLTVFVDLPSCAGFNSNILDVTILVRILAAPPANSDAADYLLTTADTIHSSTGLAVTSVEPGSIQFAEQIIPTYDLTVRLSVRRV
jgi:hypothetical protein